MLPTIGYITYITSHHVIILNTISKRQDGSVLFRKLNTKWFSRIKASMYYVMHCVVKLYHRQMLYQLSCAGSACRSMICGDISMHTPPVRVSHWQLKLWLSSIVQLFNFLTFDILWITANSGHFSTFWYLTS